MIDATFFACLPVDQAVFELSVPTRSNQLAGGQVISAVIGAALWRGSLTLVRRKHAEAAAIEASIMRLQRPGQTFLAFDTRRVGPSADPGGVILGAASPQVHSFAGNWLRIKGVPPGYIIRRGDQIGAQYGSDPVRYVLHRAWTPEVIADGAGVTPQIEVEPLIRPGLLVNAQINLVRPPIRAQLIDAAYGQRAGSRTEGAQFEFVQVLR